MEADLSSFQVYSSGVDYGVLAVGCNTEVGSVHDKDITVLDEESLALSHLLRDSGVRVFFAEL